MTIPNQKKQQLFQNNFDKKKPHRAAFFLQIF